MTQTQPINSENTNKKSIESTLQMKCLANNSTQKENQKNTSTINSINIKNKSNNTP
jgi:hypothetical protein